GALAAAARPVLTPEPRGVDICCLSVPFRGLFPSLPSFSASSCFLPPNLAAKSGLFWSIDRGGGACRHGAAAERGAEATLPRVRVVVRGFLEDDRLWEWDVSFHSRILCLLLRQVKFSRGRVFHGLCGCSFEILHDACDVDSIVKFDRHFTWEDGYCDRKLGVSKLQVSDLLLKEHAVVESTEDNFLERGCQADDRISDLIAKIMASQVHIVGDGCVDLSGHSWFWHFCAMFSSYFVFFMLATGFSFLV
ncbi:hypothetical protein BHE74_00017879, partial [Ensete ventricosum]